MSDAPKFDDFNEERIQALANILSLVAIVGRLENAAMQRVLVSLGSSILDLPEHAEFDPQSTAKLMAHVADEEGEEAAMQLMEDLGFVARAWEPVLSEFDPSDPYRLIPFAEIVFALVNHSGVALQNYDAFSRFGGPDIVLPMAQLTAALRPYKVPQPGLRWELVGFEAPADQALVGSSDTTLYLFKSAPSGIDIRFSEIPRREGDRKEYDVRLDTPLFAAFVAGLLGDMLYWVARMRTHAMPSQQLWRRVQRMLLPSIVGNSS